MTTTTVTTTAATTTTTTKTSTTTLDYTAIRLFIEQTWRQVKNYDKLLETKIATFNVMLEINSFRRMIFLLPGSDGFDDRVQQKQFVLLKNTLIIADPKMKNICNKNWKIRRNGTSSKRQSQF